MKTATTVCGRCGARISGEATREVCPACLLATGLSLLDDDSVAGVVDPRREDNVRPGDKETATQSTRILGDFGDYELWGKSDAAVRAWFIAPIRKVSIAPSRSK